MQWSPQLVTNRFSWAFEASLVSQRLKTNESNLPECWRWFIHLAFYVWPYHPDLAKAIIRKTMPFHQCEWLKKLRRQFLNFSNLLLYWLIDSCRTKMSFSKCIKILNIVFCIVNLQLKIYNKPQTFYKVNKTTTVTFWKQAQIWIMVKYQKLGF